MITKGATKVVADGRSGTAHSCMVGFTSRFQDFFHKHDDETAGMNTVQKLKVPYTSCYALVPYRTSDSSRRNNTTDSTAISWNNCFVNRACKRACLVLLHRQKIRRQHDDNRTCKEVIDSRFPRKTVLQCEST